MADRHPFEKQRHQHPGEIGKIRELKKEIQHQKSRQKEKEVHRKG